MSEMSFLSLNHRRGGDITEDTLFTQSREGGRRKDRGRMWSVWEWEGGFSSRRKKEEGEGQPGREGIYEGSKEDETAKAKAKAKAKAGNSIAAAVLPLPTRATTAAAEASRKRR